MINLLLLFVNSLAMGGCPRLEDVGYLGQGLRLLDEFGHGVMHK